MDACKNESYTQISNQKHKSKWTPPSEDRSWAHILTYLTFHISLINTEGGALMHPPGPLLSWANLAKDDTQIGKNFIPAGPTAMVNMWAITHDTRVWPDPREFRPEWLIMEDESVVGSDLRLIPFGSATRACPGKDMAHGSGCEMVANPLKSSTNIVKNA